MDELIQVLEKNGWPALFYFSLLVGGYKMLPTFKAVVKAHLGLLERIETDSTTNADNITDLVGMHDQTQRASIEHAEAILSLAESQGHKVAVEPHVKEIRKILNERTS